MYSFTDKTIAEALISKKKESNNFEVTVLLDKQQVQSGSSQKDYLINNGINVKVCKSKVQHTKIIITDDKAVFTGSYNLTNNARKKNDETLNVLESEKDIMSHIKYFKKRLGE